MRRLFLGLLMVTLGLLVVGCSSNTTTTTTSAPAVTDTSATTAPPTTSVSTPTVTVPLSGSEVVPPVQTSATGQATFTVDFTGAGVGYKLEVTDLQDVTAAHIHAGAKGVNGPVVVPLFNGPAKTGPFTGVLAEGTITPADLKGDLQGKGLPDLLVLMQGGGLYVNVHTKANPDGEIRGQISLEGLNIPSGAIPTTTQTTAVGGTETTTGY